MRGRTSFVVAQRISTVLRADKIIVLEGGRIAAEGTHRELLQSSAIYREIFDSQLGAGLPPDVAGAPAREGTRMTASSASAPGTASIRAVMQPRGPRNIGRIEKAKDPRSALRRLLPYLGRSPILLMAGVHLHFDLYRPRHPRAVPDRPGHRYIHRRQRSRRAGADFAADAGGVRAQQPLPGRGRLADGRYLPARTAAPAARPLRSAANSAGAILRPQPGRRADEPAHQRHRRDQSGRLAEHRFPRGEHPFHGRNPRGDVPAGLAAGAGLGAGGAADAVVHELHRHLHPHGVRAAAEASGRAQRGDGRNAQRAESDLGLSPQQFGHRRFPRSAIRKSTAPESTPTPTRSC